MNKNKKESGHTMTDCVSPLLNRLASVLQRPGNRTLLFALSLCVYLSLVITGKNIGHTAAAAFFPVLTAAVCWGWKAGLAAGLCSFPVNALLLTVLGLDWRHGMLSPIGLTGHVFFILAGLLIGFTRDLYLQRRDAEQRLQKEITLRTADLERVRAAEQRLESVLEQSADGVFITERDTEKILMVNRALLELVGMTRNGVLGNRPYCFMPDIGTTYRTTLGDDIAIEMDYYEKTYSEQKRLLTEGMLKGWEYYVINGNGALVPVEANVTHLLDEHGNRTGAISILRDVTERKRAEREINRANDFLNNLIENSLDCIIITDSTGHITRVNRAGLELMGFPLEEMLGKTPMVLFWVEEGWYETTAGDQMWLSKEDIDNIYLRMRDFLQDGKISNYISYIKCSDGRLAEVEHNITMLYDQQGTTVGSVSMTRDRTLRSRMEKELARQSELLSQANRELESFAYSVSHDLRAPLRSISGFSAALEEDFSSALPDDARAYLQRIQKASGRMSLLIDDLLKLSRVSRHEMKCEQVNLSALAADILAQLQEHSPERGVSFMVEPGITARGDENLLRIMLQNLLDNAWKYTARQDKPEIFFGRADEADPRAPAHERSRPIFCVRDNGVGFDMAYVDKLFGAFQRLHAEHDFPGTGIGLATVQRIAHRHGGRAWAASAPGNGARFYFTLG